MEVQKVVSIEIQIWRNLGFVTLPRTKSERPRSTNRHQQKLDITLQNIVINFFFFFFFFFLNF